MQTKYKNLGHHYFWRISTHDYIEWRFLWSDLRVTVSLICAHGDICARNVEYAGMVIKAIFHPPVRGISGAMVQALAW